MIEQLVFVGFRSQVVALDRETGAVVWKWKSRKGGGYTTVLLDGERVVVSVMGYTYCLEAETGKELWFNELAGMGTGVVSMASVRGGLAGLVAQAAGEEEQQQAAHSAVT
ncbi:MAG: outer membrane protein assembly factor BamB family protein [Phycisphaerae bacterium]